MGPLEIFFGAIAGMIILIALARGYKRELGSTLIILVAIFVLSFGEDQILDVFTSVGQRLLSGTSTSQELILVLIFQTIFIAIVFAGYAGRTFEFTGTPAPPPLGTLLDLSVGALNGYLIAGTLWYYLDRFGYPFQSLGWIFLPLTQLGEALVPFLPQYIFPVPAYWMVPVAVLIILQVRG